MTFTESLPQLPPRCKITRRLLGQARCEVRDRGITPAEAARHAGISWPSAHQAFAAAAGPVLDEPLAPVAHLGIDEHRRGRPRWMRDPGTGEYGLLADRWHTCFTDLSGGQQLLGQGEGRTADDAAYWLSLAPAAGATGPGSPRSACAVFACPLCAARCRRPRWRWTCSTSCSWPSRSWGTCRRATRELYGRRGRSGDPGTGIKNLLAATSSTSPRSSSPRSSKSPAPARRASRPPPRGSRRRSSATR